MEGKTCKCGPYAPCQEHEEHDTATVGDVAKWNHEAHEAARRIVDNYVTAGQSRAVGCIADIISRAISASERELVEALEKIGSNVRQSESGGRALLCCNACSGVWVNDGGPESHRDSCPVGIARAALAKRGQR